MTEKPCPGGGKSWSVDKAGRPICPRCYRGLVAVAGRGRSIRDLPKVPRHERPSRADQLKARRPS